MTLGSDGEVGAVSRCRGEGPFLRLALGRSGVFPASLGQPLPYVRELLARQVDTDREQVALTRARAAV